MDTKDGDRKLLGWAAKAYGLKHDGWVDDYDDGHGSTGPGLLVLEPHRGTYVWNPLDNDGDALRLAVKLAATLVVKISHTIDSVIVSIDGVVRSVRPYYGYGDPCAATRRTIVRAAAEIGRNMP